jgi:hypothetical protein
MPEDANINPNPPSREAPGSVFRDWFHAGQWSGAGKDAGELARAAWDAAILAAAGECLDYAHSGVNVYRRQVAYACKRRVEGLSTTPNVAPQPPRATSIRHGTESSSRGWLQVLVRLHLYPNDKDLMHLPVLGS